VRHFYSLKKNTTEMIRMMELLLERYKEKKKPLPFVGCRVVAYLKETFSRGSEENNQMVFCDR